MRRGLKSPNYKIAKSQNRQRGYLMITLMLVLALITIGLLAVLPDIKQQIIRDREDELRHRGTAYMRAIQRFYKKFGRYPTRVEELESTNNLRFLRKRYTDPVNIDKATGKEKDFKFLHQQDISLNNGMVLGQTPGTNLQGGASSLLGGGPGAGGLGAGTGGVGTVGGLGAQPAGCKRRAAKIPQGAIRGTRRRAVRQTALLEIRMRTKTDRRQTGLRRRIRFQVLTWPARRLAAGRFSV